MTPLVSYPLRDRPLIVAHRGSSGTAPENTLAAFRKGVEAGADMIEIDVQRTGDDEVIVFHDNVLGRTTNGSGRVDEQSLADIRNLDAGAWLSAEFAGERIPMLREALRFLHHKAYVNIELKRTGDDDGVRFLERVIDQVLTEGMEEFALLSSFEHRLLELARSIAPRIPTAVILHPHDRSLPTATARRVGASAIVLSRRQWTRRVADDTRTSGIPVGVYTINDPLDAVRIVDRGASAIVTNYPERIVGALRPAER